MNWGWKIAIVYITFALMVLSLVFISFTKKVNLVEEDYYEKEIAYQDQIDKIKNTRHLGDDFDIQYSSEDFLLSIQYSGNEEISGELHLYRPSDADLDMKLPLNLDSTGYQKINTSTLKKGLWILKANWSNGELGYFKKSSFEVD